MRYLLGRNTNRYYGIGGELQNSCGYEDGGEEIPSCIATLISSLFQVLLSYEILHRIQRFW